MIRKSFLAVSHNPTARDLLAKLPVTSDLVERFVTGETWEAALPTVRDLVDRGLAVNRVEPILNIGIMGSIIRIDIVVAADTFRGYREQLRDNFCQRLFLIIITRNLCNYTT